MKTGMITLSQKQLKTYKVINSFIDKSITRQQAAELLNLSTRQISRLKKGMIDTGAESLIHKNTGRKPPHAFSDEKKEMILGIHSSQEFQSVNFLHFKDILAEKYKLHISYSSLSSILKNAGIQSPKRKKVSPRTHRRKRKAHPGELIQIDATPYEWFGDNKKYALHGAIDDATGQIVGLYMTQNECLYGYLEMMRQCCLAFGVPQTIYSDNHTIFRSPKTGKLTVEELIAGKSVNLTQFGRSMHELGIDMIYAKTPQAKGRVERLWVTLQSRLPVELAMRNITTVEAANEFLNHEYKAIFNSKFKVTSEAHSLFIPLKDSIDIDTVLCVKHTRKTDNAGVFSFKGRCFQILNEGYPIVSAKKISKSLSILDMALKYSVKTRYLILYAT
uniref:ISNCY family transposase n=1 Tax=Vallitalea pronyensis TaxID=1348613 RepID=UPI001FEC6AF2|nr:ISNCY family transposase [Vallitalea pronyensis]